MNAVVYLGLGTNLGDRQSNISQADAALQPDVVPLRYSSIYETPPWGYLDQPTFLNQVLEAETRLAPTDLLEYLKRIELQIGRRPNFRFGPRLIDLDILLYGDLILDTPGLIIPHPFLHTRAFVLVPLAELIPDFIHPVLGKSIKELLDSVDTSGINRYLSGSQ